MVASQEDLLVACEPALADLGRARPGLLRLGPGPDGSPPGNPWGHDAPELWLWDIDSGAGTGVWSGEPDERAGDAVLRVTEVVQDAAIEAAHGAWPECPDHPDHPDRHPLEPSDAEGAAVWTCPRSGRVVAAVGELASDRSAPTA